MNFFELCGDEIGEVEEEMEALIEKREKSAFGIISPFLKRGGKRIRPLLLLLFFHAFEGTNRKNTKKMAALIEMFHNFTLIHDDIEDDSKFRRGKPTLHIEYGIPMALNSGDALYTLVWKEISELELPANVVVEVMKRCSDAFLNVVEGQAMEIAWEKENQFKITEKEYYAMISKKTGALIALSCEMGAYLAGASKDEQQIAKKFGKNIGIAFQISDDALNLTADFEKYKKEIGGDITEGKRTLIIIRVLGLASEEDKRVLMKILSSRTAKKEDIEKAISIIKKYDGIQYSMDKAKRLIDEAKQMIAKLKPSKYRDALLYVADYILSRES